MNKCSYILRATAVVALVISGASAQAESTYGYNSAGTGFQTATAKLAVTVTVPQLILLRVGGSGVYAALTDTAAMTTTLNGGIPTGGVLAPSNGNSQASIWDGTAPAWNAATSNTIRAYAWTNASGGGSVTPAISTAFSDATLAGKIAIASSTITGLGLTHPATMNLTTAMGFAKNAVASSDWIFSITAANLGTTNAGVNSAQMTYTATTL